MDIVTDTPVYRGTGTHSDHFLVLAKISLSRSWKQVIKKRKVEEIFKVRLLQEDRINKLYQLRLQTYLDE
jgi:hypothetical protein